MRWRGDPLLLVTNLMTRGWRSWRRLAASIAIGVVAASSCSHAPSESTGSSGKTAVPAEVDAGSPGATEDGSGEQEAPAIEDQPSDCVLASSLLATDLIRITSSDAVAVVPHDGEGEDPPAANAQLQLGNGASIEFTEASDIGIEDQLELEMFFDSDVAALKQALTAPEGLFLLGLRLPTVGPYFVGMLRIDGASIEGWDDCHDEWRDVTSNFGRASSAIGGSEPLDTLRLISEDKTGMLAEEFALAWQPDQQIASWTDRRPDQRYFTDPDAPQDIRDQLEARRIELAYTGPRMIGSPLAVCPRQNQAVSGYCVSLEVLSIDERIVLEIPAMPETPIELWIHDERAEPAGPHKGPFAVIVDASLGSRVEIVFPGDDTTFADASAEDQAGKLEWAIKPSDETLLADPEAAGVDLVGGASPVEP